MFRETLLESWPHEGNRKRWPMAAAFVIESIAAAVIVIIPLISTGVIPVGAASIPRIVMPMPVLRVATEPLHGTLKRGSSAPSMPAVVVLSQNPNRIYAGPPRDRVFDVAANLNLNSSGPSGPGPNMACSGCGPSVVPDSRVDNPPVLVSHLSPAQLLYRVEPVYPRPAVVMGLQGEVKLHALIAKDGTIQSLSVTSGHPMLAQAALVAVRQWRYRPYVLNGQAVEVETFITVNFRHDR